MGYQRCQKAEQRRNLGLPAPPRQGPCPPDRVLFVNTSRPQGGVGPHDRLIVYSFFIHPVQGLIRSNPSAGEARKS
jgi:hypothetical protein